MVQKIKKMFNVIFIIFNITIKILLKSEGMGSYYLARFVSSAHFIFNTDNMISKDFSAGRIYYKNNLENSDFKLIDESIQKGGKDLNKFFGQAKSYPLKIVKTLKRSGEGGYDTFAIYLPLEDLTPYTIIHEYAHFRVESIFKDKRIPYLAMPAWFDEGIAEYISFQYRTDKADYVSLDILVDFGKLRKRQDFQEAYHKGYDVYFQSCLGIKKIVELKGESCLQNILLDLKEMDFDIAFVKNTGISIEELQELLK